MKKTFIQTSIMCVLIIGLQIQTSSAQYVAQNAVFNTNIPGKVVFEDTPAWSGLFKTITAGGRKYFRPMEKNMAAICSIVTDVPVMKPPMRFTVKPYVSSAYNKQEFNHYAVPLMDVSFLNYAFYTLNSTRKIVQSSNWSSSMVIIMNDPKWLLEYNYELQNNCDSVGIAPFYYRPKMHKDKNGDWIIKPSKLLAAIHVVKKQGVPLYIPLTKKEYLEYQLKMTKRGLIADKKMLSDSKKQLQNLKYPQTNPGLDKTSRMKMKILIKT